MRRCRSSRRRSASRRTSRCPEPSCPGIDFVALARGQGCDGVNVSRAQDLRDALDDALQATVPTLVEVDVA